MATGDQTNGIKTVSTCIIFLVGMLFSRKKEKIFKHGQLMGPLRVWNIGGLSDIVDTCGSPIS